MKEKLLKKLEEYKNDEDNIRNALLTAQRMSEQIQREAREKAEAGKLAFGTIDTWLVWKLTKGEIPVIYARGNHEIKGKYSEEFHKYVGAKNEDFYYTFNIDNIYGMVLDLGEDHDDDYWEYYDTAFYEDYRNKQVKMLEDTFTDARYLAYDYKMAVCHIPVVF